MVDGSGMGRSTRCSCVGWCERALARPRNARQIMIRRKQYSHDLARSRGGSRWKLHRASPGLLFLLALAGIVGGRSRAATTPKLVSQGLAGYISMDVPPPDEQH